MALTNEDVEQLEQFETLASDDSVKTDLELTCRVCRERVCDVEHGDTLSVLVGVAVDHLRDKHVKVHSLTRR